MTTWGYKMGKEIPKDFSITMDSRGQANYSGVYTEDEAKKAIQTADSFVKRMEKLIAQNTP
jgi:uncharacterized protein (UPF0332 family)